MATFRSSTHSVMKQGACRAQLNARHVIGIGGQRIWTTSCIGMPSCRSIRRRIVSRRWVYSSCVVWLQRPEALGHAARTEQCGCDQKRIDDPIYLTPPLYLVFFHHAPPWS